MSGAVKIVSYISGLFLLLVSVCAYWNMSFYYYLLDELTMLSEFYDLGWSSIFKAQNEHFAPFFKILLYGYPKIFGNAVLPWRNFSVFVHFLATLAGFFLSLKLSKSVSLSLLFSLFFAFCPLIWETMYMQSGLGTTSSVLSWLLTLLLFLKADDSKRFGTLLAAYLMLVLQSYTFGNNLFYPLVIFALYFFKNSPFRKSNLIFAVLIQALNLYVFFNKGSFQNNQNFLGGTVLTYDLVLRMMTYFAVSFYANFGRALIAYEPSISSSLINYQVLIPFLLALFPSLFVAYKNKDSRPIILTGWVNYGLVIGLISVSRYRLPYEQCLSSRYIYLIMPALLCVLVPTLTYLLQGYSKVTYLLILGLVFRYDTTYSGLQHERFKAETLHARNYQLLVYAKDHPEVQITDFLTTAYLPTERVTGLLRQYESEKILDLDHRVPNNIKAKPKELEIRLLRPEAITKP